MKSIKKTLAIFLVIVMGLAVTACGGSNSNSTNDNSKYNGLIGTLCDSKVEANLDNFMTLFGSMETLMKEAVTQEVLDKTKATYEQSCGSNMKATYKITQEEAASDDDIANYSETIAMFGEKGEITEAYNVSVDVTVKGDKGNYNYQMKLSIGKVNDNWIIVNFNDTLLK